MKNIRIAVKYCGNCNPVIKVVEVVKEILEKMPEITVVASEQSERELTLLVSGCRRDCVTRPESEEKTVVIAGCSVDNEEYEISQLAAAAIKKIKQKLI